MRFGQLPAVARRWAWTLERTTVMTITTAAAAMIHEWLRSSGIRSPVICLVQASNTPTEVTQALERGAGRKELEQISLAALAKEPKYLYPAIYPRSHFLWLFTDIGGFRFAPAFAHPPHARRALKTGLLDVAERGLVLKDADGKVVLPKQATSAL
jgi:hypothetical protein